MRTTFTVWRRATPRLVRRPRFLSVPWRLHRTMLKGGLRLAPDPAQRLVRRRCAKVPDQSPRGFGARVYGWIKVRDGQWVLTLSRLDRSLTIERAYATWTPAGGVLESKNGGWKLVITCAGTMANIKYGAVVAE